MIESQGRAFPVETAISDAIPRERIEEAVAERDLEALAEQRGSVLVFLPGQGEITRTAALLGEHPRPSRRYRPLYGAMERARAGPRGPPAAPGRRKMVLATSIAETSITIEGVRVVVDCGLVRAPRFEPDIGLVRLETFRASRADADQRRGRAGRTQPGVCYRLWEEAATASLPAFAQPEILAADLAGLRSISPPGARATRAR